MEPSEEERDRWMATLKTRQTISDKDWWTTFWLSLVLGAVGADRYYLGSAVLATLKLVTVGGFGVWWLVDVVLVLTDRIHDVEGRLVKRPRPSDGNEKSGGAARLAPPL